jgi:hypothetical protein
MERVEQLFDGFADQPPFAFIFCGNFLSRPTANLYINDLSGTVFSWLLNRQVFM